MGIAALLRKKKQYLYNPIFWEGNLALSIEGLQGRVEDIVMPYMFKLLQN